MPRDPTNFGAERNRAGRGTGHRSAASAQLSARAPGAVCASADSATDACVRVYTPAAATTSFSPPPPRELPSFPCTLTSSTRPSPTLRPRGVGFFALARLFSRSFKVAAARDVFIVPSLWVNVSYLLTFFFFISHPPFTCTPVP